MRLHERNRAFEWRVSHAPYRLLSEAQARQYDEQGYFLFENAFTADEICAVSQAIDPLEQAGAQYLRDHFNGQYSIAKADAITFTLHLVLRSPVLKKFSLHRVFRDICHDTLGPGARLYWDQAVYKKPGNREEFPWHQDNGYTYIELQQYLTCWVPLTDATLDNGCPWVVPGVHKTGTLHHEKTPLGFECLKAPDGAVAVPAKAGDIVVFSSLTPHRTGPNLTADVRKSYILQYAPDGAVSYAPGTGEQKPANDCDRQYRVDAP